MAEIPRAIDLVYTEAGSGEPVLLLHGLGSRSADWQLQIPFLANTYRVIAPDLRGHGASPKPRGPYSVAMMTADVMALLEKLNVGPVHIIGLSMGGMIAFQMAVTNPEFVRSLVIVNSSPELIAHSIRDRFRIMQRLTLAQLTQPAQTGKLLSQRLFPKPEQEPLRERFVAEWAENDKDAYLAAMKALIGWSVLDQVGDIACPVLVISGDRDYTPVEYKRAYVAKIPGARLVTIEDSGHATPIDQAETFNRIVVDFLAAVGSDPSSSNESVGRNKEIAS